MDLSSYLVSTAFPMVQPDQRAKEVSSGLLEQRQAVHVTGWPQPCHNPSFLPLVSSLTLGQWPSEVGQQETHALGMNEANTILVTSD